MNLVRDLRFAIRLLARNRAFAIAAILVVALGTGATAAVFTVVRAVLLRPLPYAKPDRIVAVRVDSSRGTQQTTLTTQEFQAVEARSDLFESVASYTGVDGSLTGVDDMEILSAASITETFFDVLGVTPFLGRTLTLKQDFGPQFVSGVMISYELWQRRWHGDATLIGRHIEFNNIDAAVVGIMPAGFSLQFGPGAGVGRHVDLWFPYAVGGAATVPCCPAIARLRDGVTLAQARGALRELARGLVAAHPGDYRTGTMTMTATTLPEDLVRDIRPALLALTGAVVFVLLVACANLTNLLLTRACARTRELAVRTAIGASRGQLVRQLVVESVVLAAIGGAAGSLVATWGVHTLMLFAPASMPQRDSVTVDFRVTLLAIGLSLTSALIFGLVPAWQVTRTDLTASLKADPAARSKVTRGLLVSGQLALSLMLLVGAGLMARTFLTLTRAPLGYQPERILLLRGQLAFRKFPARDQLIAFQQRAVDALAALPGVERASAMTPPMLHDILIYRRVALRGDTPETATVTTTVFPDFFRAMGITLRDGREFTADDKTTKERTPVIVDRGLADQLFPGRSAIGRFVLLSPHATSEQWAEIVGVVDHIRLNDVRADGLAQLYVTAPHRPSTDVTFVVRTTGDPRALALDVKNTVERLGPGRPAHVAEPLQDLVDAQRADTRFALFVLGTFAVLALVLTAVGVYSVVAYSTARRTREIAVRRAIGASPFHIVTLVVGEGLGWTALGIAAGAFGARILARSLASLLYGIGTTDVPIFVATAIGLGAIALVASALPAIRAVRVPPMLALRSE
ncbi:MAG TPA: ABC transporter permease [Vicinamibacterales bacterium]